MGLAHTLYRHPDTEDTRDVFKFIVYVFQATFQQEKHFSGLVRIAALRCVLYSVTFTDHHNQDIMDSNLLGILFLNKFDERDDSSEKIKLLSLLILQKIIDNSREFPVEMSLATVLIRIVTNQ